MRPIHSTFLLLFAATLLAASACGDDNCLPTIYVDTAIIPASEECFEDETHDGAGTTDDPTGDEMQACGEVLGQMWGPCGVGKSCAGASTCIDTPTGSVCAPFCDGDGLCEHDQCNPPSPAPTCNANGPTLLCGYECESADDCRDGQVCDLSLCMWPH